MKDITNKYQITKTIRFKLEPNNDNARTLKPILNSEVNDESLDSLIEKMDNVQNLFKSLIYIKDKEGNYKVDNKVDNKGRLVFSKILKIKYTWMRNYLKSNFYENQNSMSKPAKKYALDDLDYVKNEIDYRLLPEWNEIFEDLKDAHKKNKDNQHPEGKKRYSQIALIISRLSKRSNFEFLKSFVDSLVATNKPYVDDCIQKLKENISCLGIEIKKQQDNFLPYQSNGLMVASGSFNYYTVNKTPKLLEQEKSRTEKKLNELIYESVGIFDGKERKKIRKEYNCNRNTITNLNLDDELSKLTLEEAYHFLKKWKANEKKIFMETLQKGNDADAKKIKLFESSEENFQTIKNRIVEIQKLGNKINNAKNSDEENSFKEELEKIKHQKNNFFDVNCKDAQTPKYKDLCIFFQEISKERGKFLTKISAIEKEKQMAEQLAYWCLIVENNERKILYLIPRDENNTLTKAKQYVETLKNEDTTNVKLHYFNSLTLRALRKLCFKEANNTFKYAIGSKVDFPQCEQALNENEKIEFYQNILKNQTTLDFRHYSNIEELCKQQFNSLNDFERELNKICYVKTVCTDANIESTLQKDYHALCFEIKSQDIDRYFNPAIDRATDCHKNKAHTRLWRSFWFTNNQRDGYPTRINPEIKIMYRDSKPSRIIKYGAGSINFEENKHNRYLHPQFTLQTTITEHALENEINYAFTDTKDKGEAILKYNSNLNNKEIQYAYGIDVGTADLASMTLISNKLIPVSFKAYKIKDFGFSKSGYLKGNIQREKPYKLMENPSYFLKRDLYDKTFGDGKYEETFASLFEEVRVSSLDLTTAKVICGKLILNGDFTTHLTLKILNAKRNISKYLKSNPQITIDICQKNEYNICLKDKDKEIETIYRSKKLYDCIRKYEDVKTELFEFYENQKLDNVRLDKRINDMRASLVGNLVGVIDFLYNTYPGFIVLENLSHSIIESHRQKFEGDITRPLEWALYRKFQTKGLVPPISELVKLREIEKFDSIDSKSKKQESIHQFGIIKFVDEGSTSLLCPSCNKKAYKSSNDEKYIHDKQKQIFQCECGFNNQTNPGIYSSLDTNDKIAGYNIAKRGFENLTKQ